MTNKKNKSEKGQDLKNENVEINEQAEQQENETTDVLDITTMAEYIALQKELEVAKQSATQSLEMVRNFKQDVDRIKERNQNMKEELTEKITISLAEKLLPILDNFEKSLEHISGEADKKGVEMIFNSLKASLEAMNIKSIVLEDNIFNPDKMEAIVSVPTEDENLVGTITSIVKTGYYYVPTEKVIRYTQVVVYGKN